MRTISCSCVHAHKHIAIISAAGCQIEVEMEKKLEVLFEFKESRSIICCERSEISDEVEQKIIVNLVDLRMISRMRVSYNQSSGSAHVSKPIKVDQSSYIHRAWCSKIGIATRAWQIAQPGGVMILGAK